VDERDAERKKIDERKLKKKKNCWEKYVIRLCGADGSGIIRPCPAPCSNTMHQRLIPIKWKFFAK
jgi:hypothetical protein